MNDLIKTDTIFGKRANIVGNISADLVLESLGKIYIKSRNKALTLEDVIKSLTSTNPNTILSTVKIVEDMNLLDVSSYKDGSFLYDKQNKILYLTLSNLLIELINISPDGLNYVRKTGDIMSGKLTINVKGGPPLLVNSSDLVKNLNAEYLNGEKATDFTRRNKDEKIGGAWSFENLVDFKSDTTFYKDIKAYGSIGSPSFSSGYGGYGWKMDANTNTLTVDNLVVRKLMQVYELVVNKISATNGSLWVTNAGKVKKVRKLDVYNLEFFNLEDANYQDFLHTTHKGDYFVKLNHSILPYKELDISAFLTASGDGAVSRDCLREELLAGARLIKVKLDNLLELNFYEESTSGYNSFNVFSNDFKFNITFPIVTRNNYQIYRTSNDQEIHIDYIYTYYKYFSSPLLDNLYLISFDSEELPVFKPGDILRCQKWTFMGIKYYDAVVCNVLEMGYVIQLAPSIYDYNTSITYDDSINPTLTKQDDNLNETIYKSTRRYASYHSFIGLVEENDSLVQIGNLWDPQRQNAVYITSVDNGAPYIDTLSEVNRPDYSVIYYTPNFDKVKLYKTYGTQNPFIGYDGIIDIPYTGDYYILNVVSESDYVYFKYNNQYYLTNNKILPYEANNGLVYYLSISPNKHTLLSSHLYSFLLSENDEVLTTEDNKLLLLETTKPILNVSSTKTTKARFGNLDGILDNVFPVDKQPYGYGLYGLNVFLVGEFYLNNGKSLVDISQEGIEFAMASERAIYENLNILKNNLELAHNLLKQNVYTKGELRTAGMYIGNDSDNKPGIVMWGNKIIIATTLNEFNGLDLATALFTNGKILAKFLEVNEVHSTQPYYNNPLVGNIWPEEDIIKIYYGDGQLSFWYYLGAPQVYIYYPIKYNGQNTYVQDDNFIYIRMYTRLIGLFPNYDNDPYGHIWLECDIHGNHLEDANNDFKYVLYKDFWNKEESPYDALNREQMDSIYEYVHYTEDPETYPNGAAHLLEYLLYQEFMEYISQSPLKLWSLHKNGKGNLGGSSIYWDTNGTVTVSGTIISNSGKISKFNISREGLFTDKLIDSDQYYNPISINGGGYDTYGNFENPSINLYSYDYNNNAFTLKSRTSIQDGIISISDGSYIADGLNYVSLSTKGLSWRKEGWDLGAAAVLFSIMFIPVKGSDGPYSAYIRCAGYGFNTSNSNVGGAFKKIIIYFSSSGDGCIVFPSIDDNKAYADWLIENLSKGVITIFATALNPCIDRTYPTFRSNGYTGSLLLTELTKSNYKLTFESNWLRLKVSLNNICFKGYECEWKSDGQSEYSVGGIYNYKYCIHNYGGNLYYDDITYGGPPINLADNLLTNNYIRFSTSDDASPNPGGVLLTFLYNNFTDVPWHNNSSSN